jgi:hypothetical protein
MNKYLQAQRDHINVDFEKWMKIQRDTHKKKLELEKKKLKTTIEKTRASMCIVESIKVEVLSLSEELTIGENEILNFLNSIQDE